MSDSRIIHGDCIEGMAALDAGSFNLIVADPPYNLNKDFGPWKETERADRDGAAAQPKHLLDVADHLIVFRTYIGK